MADDDWDLYAVVRSCRLTGPPPPAADSRDPFSSFLPPAGEVARFHGVPAPPAAVPDLEELCRSFFSTTQHQLQQQSSSSSLSFSPSAALTTARPRQPHRPLSQTSRSKRRKNQQKRVVCNVPVDGATADMWAWRKYGQKPIKGSPFPRGYYRCSSSKGCPARKQVERSRTDPGTLLITYTAEHSHPVPTHRNSLAGSTRHRFPTADPPTSSPLSTGLSPTTPLTASMEDEEDEEGTLLVEDMEVMGEDDLFFMGVDDVVGPTNGGSAAFLDDDDDVFFAGGW